MLYKTTLFLTVICAGLVACNNKTTTNNDTTIEPAADSSTSAEISLSGIDSLHTSQNALDWAGTYEGLLPCADCPGMETYIVLNEDETFSIRSIYQERDVEMEDKGSFSWIENGSTVHLKGESTDIRLKVGENILFYLDQEGNMMEGPLAEHYILRKKS